MGWSSSSASCPWYFAYYCVTCLEQSAHPGASGQRGSATAAGSNASNCQIIGLACSDSKTGEIILLHSLWKAFSQRMDSGVNMNGNICYICSNSFLTCILNPLLFTVLQHRFLPSFSNVQFFWIYKCIYEDRNRKVASCLSCGLDDSKKEFRSLYTLSEWPIFKWNILNVTSTACTCFWKMAASSQRIHNLPQNPPLSISVVSANWNSASHHRQCLLQFIPPARHKWHHCGEERVKAVWYKGFVIIRQSFISWCYSLTYFQDTWN